jgi:hypothetical protein
MHCNLVDILYGWGSNASNHIRILWMSVLYYLKGKSSWPTCSYPAFPAQVTEIHWNPHVTWRSSCDRVETSTLRRVRSFSCNCMKLGHSLKFRRKVSPPSSLCKSEPMKEEAEAGSAYLHLLLVFRLPYYSVWRYMRTASPWQPQIQQEHYRFKSINEI